MGNLLLYQPQRYTNLVKIIYFICMKIILNIFLSDINLNIPIFLNTFG